MDKEKARFILESFRPDGADAGDADFADALRLATVDRELGAWLMRERAFDAEFAEALARVELPEGLREKILLGMVQDSADTPRVNLEKEAEMMQAMAGIAVPDGLRERILVAMEQSSRVPVEEKGWRWPRLVIPLAAAASIAMAFVFLQHDSATGTTAGAEQISVDTVEAEFVELVESPVFSLDMHHEDVGILMAGLRERGLPVADSELPPGLDSLKGKGCRKLLVDGKEGTLVCFDTGAGMVHLVTFRRSDISGELPGMENPKMRQQGEWVTATWGDETHSYTLLQKSGNGDLDRYF